MDTKPAIRPAEPADAPTVARLLHDFNAEFEDHTPPVDEVAGHCERLLREGAMAVLLAEAGGLPSEPAAQPGEPAPPPSEPAGAPLPVGLSLLRLRPSPWTGAEEAYLQEFYVVPDRRRQGIGQVLLEATIDTARAAGARMIDLNTGATDTGARALYEKLGFTNEEGPGGPQMLFYERDI